ncbi:MAG: LacI family DNA-binding transcriptional regulator [Peptostreptococcaceae bacterium]|nr:LacI family DNA-binding transcriptional regulator [Peptostreptococcaceae bacterium]
MSLKKVSHLTGLSIATISHVINGTRTVSPQSRKKVMEAVQKIGYKPNLAARILKTKISKTIALVIPGVEPKRSTNYFFMDVITGVRNKLIEVDYDLIVSTYGESKGEKDLRALQVLKKQWVDGILIVPDRKDGEQIKQINEINIPCVIIDRRIDGGRISSVDSNNEKGAYDAVKILCDSGKKRIGFVGGYLHTSTGYGRFNGYKKAINELGLVFDESIIALNDCFTIKSGISSAKKLLENNIDGIFVADNLLTMGVMKHLMYDKIKIPDQIGVVGYDDYDWMELVTPTLTTIKQQAYEMGYIAAEILLRKLNGFEGNEKIILDTKLIIRESHGIIRV